MLSVDFLKKNEKKLFQFKLEENIIRILSLHLALEKLFDLTN